MGKIAKISLKVGLKFSSAILAGRAWPVSKAGLSGLRPALPGLKPALAGVLLALFCMLAVQLGGLLFCLPPAAAAESGNIYSVNDSAAYYAAGNQTHNLLSVSVWQGENIDWQAVKASGVEYVIVRAGYGWTGRDENFTANIRGAYQAGLQVGVYLYSYAATPQEAEQEFANLQKIIRPYQKIISLPVFYDLEDNDTQGSLTIDELTAIAVTFCDLVKEAGYTPGIYSNLSWLTDELAPETIQAYKLWVAQYYEQCQYSYPFTIWEYTDTGSVEGIDAAVCQGYCYETFAPAARLPLFLVGYSWLWLAGFAGLAAAATAALVVWRRHRREQAV